MIALKQGWLMFLCPCVSTSLACTSSEELFYEHVAAATRLLHEYLFKYLFTCLWLITCVISHKLCKFV